MSETVKLSSLCPAIFGVTEKRYRQLAQEGHVPTANRGTVDRDEATRAYIAHLHDRLARKDVSEADGRRRKELAQAGREELKLAKESESLIERAVIADEFARRVYTLKADLLALPRRLAKWPEAKTIVDRYLKQLMKNYAKPTGALKGEEK